MRSYSLHLGILTLGIALLSTAVTVIACSKTPTVEVELLDPLKLRETATFVQIAAFDEGCPPDETLAEGNIAGAVYHVEVAAEGDLPELAEFEKKSYGFAIFLREEDCGVIAYGCTTVDFEHHRTVRIAANKQVNPIKGACDPEDNKMCVLGQCVKPPNDASVDTGPPTCTLELKGSGNFDDIVDVGSSYAGPDVAALPNGFVIAYREINAAGDHASAVRVIVDDNGEVVSRTDTDTPFCPGDPISGGVAVAWHDTVAEGLMVVGVPQCDTTDSPRVQTTAFGADGVALPERGVLYDPSDAIEIKPPASLVPLLDTTFYSLTAKVNDTAIRFQLNREAVVLTGREEILNAGGTATYAQVAAFGDLKAWMRDSTGGGDGGASTVLYLQEGADPPAKLVLPAAPFATLDAWENRVGVLMADATRPDNDLHWYVYDSSGAEVEDKVLAGNGYYSVAMQAHGQWLLMAGGDPQKITLWSLDGVDGSLDGTPDQVVLDHALDMDAVISEFSGRRFAMAAARRRVMVVWLTSTDPIDSSATPPGGYAVLACDG